MKRLLASVSIIMLISTAFLSGYFKYQPLSVYAEEWQPIASGEEVEAFIAYCKSRNLNIESSIIDNDAAGRSVIAFTYSVYKELCSQLGLDPNQVQATIKKNTSSEGVTNWLFSDIGMMNRLFNAYLQKYDLSVGDTVDNQNLYSGKWFVDADGNGCLVYVLDSTSISGTNNGLSFSYNAKFSSIGSDYRFSNEQIINLVGTTSYNFVFHLTSSSNYSVTLRYLTNTSGWPERYAIKNSSDISSGSSFYYKTLFKNGSIYYPVKDGKFIISQRGADLYLADIRYDTSNSSISATESSPLDYRERIKIVGGNAQNANVYITTNNTTINNNNYEGDTIINNNGKVTQPDKPIPDPNDDHTTVTNPVQPDLPDSDSNLTFPLIDLDIPSIDWSLGDLSDKFPFSIPFDLIAFFTVLNAEPETPELQGQIDLGIVTWDIDWNLSDFDNIAKILRNLEFIGFCIGLILITRSLIKG